MKPNNIEFICRTIVCIASLTCTTAAAIMFQKPALLWWYVLVLFMIDA